MVVYTTHGRRDLSSNVVSGCADRIAPEVSVPLRRLGPGMAEHLADDEKPKPGSCAEAGEGVAQVVKADTFEPCFAA